MFYKYQVSYWFDATLCDGCGIVFGSTVVEATAHLSKWYGKDCISNLTLDAIDLDTDCPVLDMGICNDVLDATIEAVER